MSARLTQEFAMILEKGAWAADCIMLKGTISARHRYFADNLSLRFFYFQNLFS